MESIFFIRYELKDISKIEIESYNGLGNAFDVYHLNKKHTYPSRIALMDLEDMVNELNSSLKLISEKTLK